ncbi:hypothetical protein [Streptomyces mirabilis]|uniref:hypothetical protein n=1 Tax=Streptomyces mirabilis TaxID=68239 RepID=UPI0033283DF8
MVTIALIRSCSVGVRPVVGSVVTSPTVKIPNCIAPISIRLMYQLHGEHGAGPRYSVSVWRSVGVAAMNAPLGGGGTLPSG